VRLVGRASDWRDGWGGARPPCYDAGVIRNWRVLALTTAIAGGGAGACDTCGGSSTTSTGGDASGSAPSGDDAAAAVAEIDAATSCAGSAVDLAQAISDPTCAITSGIAKSTRAVFEIAADAGKHLLKQEAVRLGDGRVEIRLVNHGTMPTAVPLSWHPKIPAFIVLADNIDEKAIYELEAPPLAVDLDGGPATARFARVTIAPGGYAFARIVIDPKIVKRAGGKATATADSGPMPEKIGQGKWTLHVGQLVTDVFTGEPASMPWVNEVTD
jgi:hypothetical protein